MRIVDLSYRLSPDTPRFADSPRVELEVLERTEDPEEKGRRSLNVTRLSVMVHTGTHMDAPFHFFRGGVPIDLVPLEWCLGPALLVNFDGLAPGDAIELRSIAGLREKLLRIPRIVLNTGWAAKWGTAEYFTDHPCISGESADFLVACGVQLIGVDMPSVDRPPFPAHLRLLGNGVVIVENLTNLENIGAEEFGLTVLPLKLAGRDGSPVRAIALV